MGYYLACAATRVLAEATSLIGSIGVVGGKLVIGQALEKHGITSVTLAASPDPRAKARATYLSALTAWDEPTRQRIRHQMQEIYELFVSRVAAGRRLSKDRVKQSAEGRVWTGAQARERGLVDELGGLGKALALARTLAGVDERAPVVVEGGIESLLEALFMPEGASDARLLVALQDAKQRQSALERHLPESWKAAIQSAEPLLGQERVLTALPFAVTIR